MKKIKITAIIASICLLCSGTASASASLIDRIRQDISQTDDVPIYANGTRVQQGDLPTLNYAGNTYIPLRKIAEGTGLTVDWNNATRTITIGNPYIQAYDYTNLAMLEKQLCEMYYLATAALNDMRALVYLNEACKQLSGGAFNSDNYDMLYERIYGENGEMQMLEERITQYTQIKDILFPNGYNTNIAEQKKHLLQQNGIYAYCQAYIDVVYAAKDYFEGKTNHNDFSQKWNDIVNDVRDKYPQVEGQWSILMNAIH